MGHALKLNLVHFNAIVQKDSLGISVLKKLMNANLSHVKMEATVWRGNQVPSPVNARMDFMGTDVSKRKFVITSAGTGVDVRNWMLFGTDATVNQVSQVITVNKT